jgi:glycerol-3-phosphate acyltransferase PlsY
MFWIRHQTLGTPIAYAVFGLMTLALIMWALRPNIKRLLEGREHLVGWRARAAKKRQNVQPNG